MCIQVDNPMNILNQDLARQFISSSTPEEKYNVILISIIEKNLNNNININIFLKKKKNLKYLYINKSL